MLRISPAISIPDDELQFTFVRSSGPGGQNVNKVNSKAVLRWNAAASAALPDDVRERFLKRFASRITATGDIVLTSQRYRDQGRNTEDCREKLRAMLLSAAAPPKTRRATRPTRAARERRHESKQRLGAKKKARRFTTSEE